MEKSKYFNMIDDYILERLDTADLEDFNRELKINSKLAKAIEEQRIIYDGIIIAGRRKLKSELKVIHKKLSDENGFENKKRTINWKPFLIAASLFAVGILVWIFNQNDATQMDSLFAYNYSAFELKLTVRDNSLDPSVLDAIETYQEKKYEAAIPLLKKILLEKDDSQIRMALANSMFESGMPSEALAEFQKIIVTIDPFFMDGAKWYSAMINLKLNQKEKAIFYLSELSETPSADYHKEAKKLLKVIQ